MHKNHGNFNVTGSTPDATGDREWAHDFVRNFQYLRSLTGLLGRGILGDDLFLSGGENIIKSDNNTALVSELMGICRVPVSVPDDESGWSIPMPYKTDEIFMAVRAQNKIVMFPNGDGTVKLRFADKAGGLRTRRFTSGDYVYCMADDAVISANSDSPTAYELVVADYTGAGSNLVITPVKTLLQKLQETIDNETANRQNADIALGKRIDSQEGQGGYLDAYNFGKANPTLQEFLAYYCSEIWGSGVFAYNGTDPKNSTLTTPDGTVHYCYEIFNSTSVHNLFNNHKWILTNTPSTTPPAFAIADVGEDIVGSATDTYAGVSKLYNATGGNVDGAMTQAAATSAMNSETNAAQVLAKLLTVDGANSGLDADLLDGQQGAYYQNAGNLNAGTIPAGRMPAHTGDVTSTAGGVALTLNAAQVLAKLLTVDGANSGLDADLLDGYQVSQIAKLNDNVTFNTVSVSTDPAYPA
jgi:hypothetical protein